jgi:hypothetical protein
MQLKLRSSLNRKLLSAVTCFVLVIPLTSCSSEEESALPTQSASPDQQVVANWSLIEEGTLVDAQTFYSNTRGAFRDDSDTFGKEEYWALTVRCNSGKLSFYVGLRPVSDDNLAIAGTSIFAGGNTNNLVASYSSGTDDGDYLLAMTQYLTRDDSILGWDGQSTTTFFPEQKKHTLLFDVLNSDSFSLKGSEQFAEIDLKFNTTGGYGLPQKLSNAGCSVW